MVRCSYFAISNLKPAVSPGCRAQPLYLFKLVHGMYSSKLTSREADLKRQIPAVSLNLVVSVYFDRLVLIGRSDLYQTAARDQTKRLSLPSFALDW